MKALWRDRGTRRYPNPASHDRGKLRPLTPDLPVWDGGDRPGHDVSEPRRVSAWRSVEIKINIGRGATHSQIVEDVIAAAGGVVGACGRAGAAGAAAAEPEPLALVAPPPVGLLLQRCGSFRGLPHSRKQWRNRSHPAGRQCLPPGHAGSLSRHHFPWFCLLTSLTRQRKHCTSPGRTFSDLNITLRIQRLTSAANDHTESGPSLTRCCDGWPSADSAPPWAPCPHPRHTARAPRGAHHPRRSGRAASHLAAITSVGGRLGPVWRRAARPAT
jgi:hypothetical protein